MEAPKKIYICPSDLAGIDYDEEWLEFPWGDNNIEYTRTDAFIKKACEFMETYPHMFMGVMRTEMIEDFKNYMKEE